MAITDELRALHPDLQVDWLTQHPVTALLEAKGERVHPASHHLADSLSMTRLAHPEPSGSTEGVARGLTASVRGS